MRILAIDPGTTMSAYALYCTESHSVIDAHHIDNEAMRTELEIMCTGDEFDALVIEMIASYGMSVGAEVFQTCVWIGRFVELAHGLGHTAWLMPRRDVKMHLCGSNRAKDGNIRQAIIDQFPAVGGGKIPQVGTKSQPGPLFGVSGDMWAALGVALTRADQLKNRIGER